MRFDAQSIAQATGGQVIESAGDGEICTDTRSLPAGAWFLALKGERFDGHTFLTGAVAEKARGCVASDTPDSDWQCGVVMVGDTTRALQDLGRAARRRLRVPIVGLTGSSGKTTTRTLIRRALDQMGLVHDTQGNLNNHLGVPMTLLACPPDADVVVAEMGTSAPGEIELLADILAPTIRLVVNVGPAHLLELGGLSGVAREKCSLFDTARAGDVVVLNIDDPWIREHPLPPHVSTVTFGRSESADISLVDATLERPLNTRASFRTPTGPLEVLLPVPGIHIAHDAAGALAVAHALGLDLKRAAADLEAYEPVGMRMRTEDLPGGAVAINDAYNANPASMEASLRVLQSLPGRRVAVLGDMLELGEEEGEWHAKVASLADSLGLDLLVLVGPRMSAAAESCSRTEVWAHVEGLDAVSPLRQWLAGADYALFKGSRGARVERILQQLGGEDNP
ncbi:MAG: UDP-N-acetylmuramoyl-tripeptide--D-alanyl-D-alanine ligase [Proteobacteria bacterium]|jgi:UDP-N-acetylmuramoyl-tripeptide--D-alanyl-D-alanine ligase|nr:UDP-N-acetylmuramoyl-tripeptide--D-alanyl-D-alanine ligase [Pseudomonadota bacterium]